MGSNVCVHLHDCVESVLNPFGACTPAPPVPCCLCVLLKFAALDFKTGTPPNQSAADVMSCTPASCTAVCEVL